MQREIKFRAWDGKKMWHKGEEMFWLIGDSGYFSLQDHGNENLRNTPSLDGHKDLDIINSCDNEQLVLMQFTGLHDKQGREIYEGDIVRFSYYATIGVKSPNGDEIQQEETVGGVVVYLGTAFCFETESHWNGCGIDTLDGEGEIEIIGNVHQHPELLE